MPAAGTSSQDAEATAEDPDITAQPSAKTKPSPKSQFLKEALQRSAPPTDPTTHQACGAEHSPLPKSVVLDESPHLDQSETGNVSSPRLSSESPSRGEVTWDEDGAAPFSAVAPVLLAAEKQEGEEGFGVCGSSLSSLHLHTSIGFSVSSHLTGLCISRHLQPSHRAMHLQTSHGALHLPACVG